MTQQGCYTSDQLRVTNSESDRSGKHQVQIALVALSALRISLTPSFVATSMGVRSCADNPPAAGR